jgi:hypothetical protein
MPQLLLDDLREPTQGVIKHHRKEKGASAMKHIKTMFLLLPALLLAPIISADQPTLGTGTFTPASPPRILDMRVADGNTFIIATQPFTVVGTLTGTEVLTFHEVNHPDGTVNIQSFGVFTGTVNGISGTVGSRNVSTGDNNSQEGHLILFDGTDGLATLHAEGTFTFVGAAGTYSGSFHFD